MAFCPLFGLHLKPIIKMTISVALSAVAAGESISHWEVMGRLLGRRHHHQLRGAVQVHRGLQPLQGWSGEESGELLLPRLDGTTILKVRSTEFQSSVPTSRHWGSFFHDTAGRGADTSSLERLP